MGGKPNVSICQRVATLNVEKSNTKRPPTPPVLEMRGVVKTFPGVRALDGVDLTLHSGEVLALLGENGAGKSTLIKILGGAHRPDEGEIRIDGQATSIRGPADAMAKGIGIIYQEFNLVPGLTPWENIFLGRSPAGFVRRGDERKRARELFAQIGVDIPLDVPAGRLSVAQQQIIEIAKALSQQARIIVMDEPSAALTPVEVDRLFEVVRDLTAQGIGVIYISHRLDEIFTIANRVTFLRDGQHVADAPIESLDRAQMIRHMVGRSIEQEFPRASHEPGDTRLELRGLTRGDAVKDVSFTIRRGEILGLTGLVGAGRTETARLIAGADRRDGGTISLDGKTLKIRSPRQGIANGICLLTEDRKAQGLNLGASVRENFGLPNLREFSTASIIRQAAEKKGFDHYQDALAIKVPHREQLAKNLSGGNQQKVVLAKWLQQNSDVLIFDEPTRGIDVGAKYEIYLLINDLAAQGKCILLISSELPEVLGLSHRILVMSHGRIVGELTDVPNATQEDIMQLAVAEPTDPIHSAT